MSTRSFGLGVKHSVFLTKEGVYTSGSNYYGQLGVKTRSSKDKPQKVIALEREEIVSVGRCIYSTVFLTKNGRVFTCGDNEKGQLGIGDEKERTKPVLVPFPSEQSIQAIVCGAEFMMALITNGRLFGWGANDSGQIGVGRTSTLQTTPAEVESLSSHKILSVACGDDHTLALTKEGKLFSWGWNEYGQLGHGDNIHKHTPTIVSALSQHRVTQIACGESHNIILTKERNRVFCFSWGCGIHGQLGHGDEETQSKPKLIETLKEETVTLVDCGYYHSLVMTRNDTIFTWGRNIFGQLCLGDRKDRVLPTKVKTLDKKYIACAFCTTNGIGFITTKGFLLACGVNDERQLTPEDVDEYSSPVEVPLPSKILLPLKVYIERAVRECAIIILLVLSPFFKPRKRKRDRTQVGLYFPREIWLEILRRAFFDDIPFTIEKEKEMAVIRAWKIGMK